MDPGFSSSESTCRKNKNPVKPKSTVGYCCNVANGPFKGQKIGPIPVLTASIFCNSS